MGEGVRCGDGATGDAEDLRLGGDVVVSPLLALADDGFEGVGGLLGGIMVFLQ